MAFLLSRFLAFFRSNKKDVPPSFYRKLILLIVLSVIFEYINKRMCKV